MALGFNKKNIRLVVKGYYGKGLSAQVQNLTSQAVWNRIAKRPDALTNVRRYRDKKQALTGETKNKGSEDNEYSIKQPAIGLTYTPKYVDSHNSKSAYRTTPSTQAQYLTDTALRFRGATKALYFDNAKPVNPVAFTSDGSAGFTINEDRTFSLQTFIFEPDSDATQDVKAWMWGTQGIGIPEWRFEIRNGNLTLMRLTPQWSVANQAFYDALLNTEGALSDSAQLQKDTIERTIYAQTDSLSLGMGRKAVYGNPLEFTFRPEPRGLYEITNEGSDAGANGTERFDTVENTDITKKRTTGTMFKKSLLWVTSSGGAFMWQLGFPEFARSGQIKLPPFTPERIIPLADRIFAKNATVPAGTTLVVRLAELSDGDVQVIADFTSDTHSTPLLYTASFTAQGSARDGSDETFWDSADFETPYKSLIVDGSFSHEGAGKPTTLSLTMLNDKGQLAGPSPSGTNSILSGFERGLRAFHDRLCDIYAEDIEHVNGAAVVTDSLLVMGNCIITSAQPSAMAEVVQDEFMNEVVRTVSTGEFKIVDQQAILDEDLMQDDELIGDGVVLGRYVHDHIENMHAKNAERAGIDTTIGYAFKPAVPGESPRIRPKGGSRGSFLRSLIERYGMVKDSEGRRRCLTLDHVAGVWTLAAPSTEVLQINGQPLTFSTDPTANQYPILQDLDYLRDFSDFYNDIYVEGGEQWDGSRVRVHWRDYRSISDPTSLNYIGRLKALPDEQSDDIRTEDDAWWVIGSLTSKHNLPGRFFSFPTVFIKELLLVNNPRVLVHSAEHGNLTCEIVRMGNSSIKKNEMDLTIREII